ncbi:hypothetical protein JVT61DRAFT_9586 [Boletus reticuloceps]|uniref:Uncharacterized protein n=1 Tax=Boletus reticuloceps TaxID=495285 RepID=A0A8I2YG40_9AGAM|nr:hypothetical protein JVT61DRAFT_9586 [Boletus reticuloceps]
MSRYSLRSQAPKEGASLETPWLRHHALSESSLPTLSPVPDLGLESPRDEAPIDKDVSAEHDPYEGNSALPEAMGIKGERVKPPAIPGSLQDNEGQSSVDHTAYEGTRLDPEPITWVHPSADSEGWTTVARKKKPSTYGRSQKGNISIHNAQRSYESTLFEAEQSLTADEQRRIQNRATAEGATRTPYSEEEDSIPDKGKEPDPRNWGQLDLNSDELDPDVQRSVLDQWKSHQTVKQTESENETVISEDREKAKYVKAYK